MGNHFKQGFTIIETMLVLAITGVLISTLLVGVGSSINAQRYKDSVTSFATTLQSQYSQVDNVTNVRELKGDCGSAVVPVDNTAGVAPGQSDCVLMGRYVTVVNDTIQTASVLGYTDPNIAHSSATNDINDITLYYNLGLSQASATKSTLEWGASIAWPTAGVDSDSTGATPTPPARAITVMIIRSPVSGTTYTFTSNKVYAFTGVTSANMKAMMTAANSQRQRFICIDPSPGSTQLTVPEKYSVMINQGASASSSVEVRSDVTTKTAGGDTKCQ